ncbi:hypothetical protein Daus18300_001726 [Diaporthe australafricana]|uniref:Cerato-platanin n=1 Tax=Diaporthe australafricana TaxID=127596 RepID=A0ABR3XUC4_9PEZI
MLWLLPVILGFGAHATAQNLSFPASGSFDITPHDSFGSSTGVLGCKVNVNRMAYWPYTPSCDGMCVKLTFGSRSRTVLHADTSGGAHDISFDAFQYLAYGTSATDSPALLNPASNGAVKMDYEVVDMDQCADIITSDTGKLAFMAASPNQVNACLGEGGNWVAENYELRNIGSPTCQYGVDEVCTFDKTTGIVDCPSGVNTKGSVALSPAQPVIDLSSPCGTEKISGEAPAVPKDCATEIKAPDPSS